MRGILMLFQKKSMTNPEEFVNPNVTSVKKTIECVPNIIYSQGMPTKRIFEEAQRFLEYDMDDLQTKITDFYKNKYALWIDVQTMSHKHSTRDGKKLVQTQSGV